MAHSTVSPLDASMAMDVEVRVWYTLDSSPHRMLAPLGRPHTIDVLSASNHTTTASPPPKFARITLKTCLSAICISSPELILDRSRDYTLYVVDPEQTHKASIRAAKHTQQQQQSHSAASCSSSSTASSSRTREPSRDSSVVVGKGFLQWILEEDGDGETVVTGRVTEEGDATGDAYLDVEIRMKETKAQSREQYFAMLRQFGGASNSKSSAHTQPLRSTSTPGALARPKQKKLLPPTQHRSSSPGPSSSASSPPPTSSSTPKPSQPPPSQQSQALQILQLLQALQARQTANASQPPPLPPPPSQPSNDALLSQALAALGGDHSQIAQQQISGAVSLDAQIQSLLQLQQQQQQNQFASQRADPSSSANASSSGLLQCYNCGIEDTNKATWRLVTLAQDQKVQYPRAFECDPHSAEPNAEEKPPIDAQGYAIANGYTSWRACNRCGLFWTKWKQNRPETLEKKRGIKRKVKHPPAVVVEPPQPAMPAPRATDDEERDEIQDSSPSRSGGESQTFVHNPRDAHASLPAKKKKRIRRAAAMDLVQDKNGVWRTKRSVQENPEGRRPGRPPGCKTGEGQGKSRDNRRRMAKLASEGGDGAGSDGLEASSSEDNEKTSRPPFAQSSPLRRTYPWQTSAAGTTSSVSKPVTAFPYGAFHSTPGFSPSRKRYGAPSHILNSSPSTALDALLSEGGDFNFDFTHPSAAAALFNSGNHGVDAMTGSPLRRSPRKDPNGTRGEQRNPYATSVGASGSPLGRTKLSASARPGSTPPPQKGSSSIASPMLDMDLFAAFTNFKSPASNHCSPAGARAQGNSLTVLDSSSSPSRAGDGDDDDDDETRRLDPLDSSVLTSLTSPGSPSPSGNRFEAKLVRGKRRAGDSSPQGSVESSQEASASGTTLAADDEQEEDDDDDDEGPDSPTRARQERLGSQRCPPSPSIGQKRKRDTAARGGSAATTPRGHDSHVLTKGPSPSPAASLRSSKANAADAGLQTPSKRLLTPRSTKTSPGKSFATSLLRASLSPAQKKAFEALSPQQQQAVARRRPLPATVEDAPASSAGSSPRRDDDDDDDDEGSSFSPYDHGTVESFLDMLEDPYGLLAANGIGLGSLGSTSVEISGGASGDNGSRVTAAGTSASRAGAVSIDHFAGGVQLHDRLQFGSHLRDFTTEGSKGVAAYALPGVTSVPTKDDTSSTATSRTPIEAGSANNDKENVSVTSDVQSGKGQQAQTTPKKSSGLTPASPGRGTRTSPRFNRQAPQTPSRRSDSSMGPPKTPGRTALNDTPSRSVALHCFKTPPKTPRSGRNSSENAVALASAVARSPALKRMLNGTSMSPGGANVSTLDFSAIFASGGVPAGTYSPFVMPAASAGGLRTPTKGSGTFHYSAPMSPSLSRLLNSMAESDGGDANQQQQQQQSALTTTPADADKALEGGQTTEMPPEAFAELQAMFQDPNFAAFFEDVSQQIAQQEQQQQQGEHSGHKQADGGRGREATTTTSS